MTPAALAARLRAERLNIAASQRDIARALHVSVPTVCQWERGTRSPSLQHAIEWARQLGLELTLAD